MKSWLRHRRFLLPVVVLTFFLVNLIFSFVKTQNMEEQIIDQVTTAMWLVSQAEAEYLRFLTTLEGFHRGDPAITRDHVAQRFEIFRSRLPVLLEGPEAPPLRAMLGDDLEIYVRPLLARLESLNPMVYSLERDNPGAFEAIRSALMPYGSKLHRLVVDAQWRKGRHASLYRVRDVTLYLEVGPSLAGMLFSGVLLIALLVREIRRGDDLLRKSQAAEGALVQARNVAEQASAAKSRFLVAANHDLRQPLQSLSLYTAAMQGTKGEGERETICEEMSGAIETMGNLLDVLLDIDNLEEGRVRINRIDFAVSKLLDSLEREFRLPVEDKNLDLRIVPSSLVLRSDPLLLERIVQNFVSNAISYTNSGRVVVGCRLRESNARIEVWDSGVGIAESKLSSIFEDYYQVDNPARDRRRGLGLGLAIAQRVARLLDHDIEVHSRPGQGSMFAVEVPVVGRTDEAGEAPIGQGDEAPDLAGRVLVAIEDDSTILDGMRRLLALWGAQVVCGSTAREALDQLSRAGVRPDLVIADYRLPSGRTGVAAVQAIRAAFDSNLPAIVITGDTSTSVTRFIETSGCQLVHKPLDSHTLRRLVQEQLGENVGRRINGLAETGAEAPVMEPEPS